MSNLNGVQTIELIEEIKTNLSAISDAVSIESIDFSDTHPDYLKDKLQSVINRVKDVQGQLKYVKP